MGSQNPAPSGPTFAALLEIRPYDDTGRREVSVTHASRSRWRIRYLYIRILNEQGTVLIEQEGYVSRGSMITDAPLDASEGPLRVDVWVTTGASRFWLSSALTPARNGFLQLDNDPIWRSAISLTTSAGRFEHIPKLSLIHI